MLISSALKLGKGDQVKAAIEARARNPIAAEPARMLLEKLEADRKRIEPLPPLPGNAP